MRWQTTNFLWIVFQAWSTRIFVFVCVCVCVLCARACVCVCVVRTRTRVRVLCESVKSSSREPRAPPAGADEEPDDDKCQQQHIWPGAQHSHNGPSDCPGQPRREGQGHSPIAEALPWAGVCWCALARQSKFVSAGRVQRRRSHRSVGISSVTSLSATAGGSCRLPSRTRLTFSDSRPRTHEPCCPCMVTSVIAAGC